MPKKTVQKKTKKTKNNSKKSDIKIAFGNKQIYSQKLFTAMKRIRKQVTKEFAEKYSESTDHARIHFEQEIQKETLRRLGKKMQIKKR